MAARRAARRRVGKEGPRTRSLFKCDTCRCGELYKKLEVKGDMQNKRRGR